MSSQEFSVIGELALSPGLFPSQLLGCISCGEVFTFHATGKQGRCDFFCSNCETTDYKYPVSWYKHDPDDDREEQDYQNFVMAMGRDRS